MNTDKLLLLIIDYEGGKISGKTLLQKKAYFLSIFLELNLEYRPHYYGPYSIEVENGLSKLKSLGFIEETTLGFGVNDSIGFEVRRYDYTITDDGKEVVGFLKSESPDECRKVKDYLDKMKRAGDNSDYINLSIAAKTLHILLSKSGQEITEEGIVEAAKELGWDISPESLEKAIDFLSKLYETTQK